jgi:hypothetical protein
MLFTNRTFELLSELEEDGKYSFYKEYEDDFQKHLVLPFRRLVIEGVIPLLHKNKKIMDLMETKNRIFGQINKNDFGRGGANPFYWGAIYPKRSANKQKDAQLLTFINSDYLEFGFFFGWQTNDEHKEQLMNNCGRVCQSKDFNSFVRVMENRLPGKKLIYRDFTYPKENFEVSEIGSLSSTEYIFDWKSFFQEYEPINSPMVVLPKETVIKMSFKDLSQSIATTFEGLFQLVLLATAERPEQVVKDAIKVA